MRHAESVSGASYVGMVQRHLRLSAVCDSNVAQLPRHAGSRPDNIKLWLKSYAKGIVDSEQTL